MIFQIKVSFDPSQGKFGFEMNVPDNIVALGMLQGAIGQINSAMTKKSEEPEKPELFVANGPLRG